MNIWAIADLHLSFGVPDKGMDLFGEQWQDWTGKIEANWKERISKEDLVLIPGDISWAMTPEEALPDLEWIDRLPGTKLILKGNHDFWWSSLKKVRDVLPPSIHCIQNNAFHWNGVGIGGARLWDTPEYDFDRYIERVPNPRAKPLTETDRDPVQAEKIFVRELHRLEMSLQAIDPEAKTRIAMTHYPPIGAEMEESRASAVLEQYGISICVFGHLHSLKKGVSLFGEKREIRYRLTSCDAIDFCPVHICESR